MPKECAGSVVSFKFKRKIIKARIWIKDLKVQLIKQKYIMEKTEFFQQGEAGTVHITNPEKTLSNRHIIAAAGGSFLTVLGLSRGGLLGAIAAVTGGVWMYKGISGRWPFSNAISKNTDVDVSTSIIINEPKEVLYSYWRNLENLPKFMKHLQDVDEVTKTRSRWSARIPGGLGKLEWEAEIIQDEENRIIAWRSLPDSEIQNSGEVRFEDMPGGMGTRVKTRISYLPPAGEIGELAAKFLNPAFSKIVKNDLRWFKGYMETGSYQNPDYDLWAGEKPGSF